MTRKLARILVLGLLTVLSSAPLTGADVPAEHHAGRKVVKRVLPAYPELARQLQITGAVKLLVMVEPSGKVKSARAMGGNPTFVEAAMAVIGKWKFEPEPQESTENVEIDFKPSN